MRTGDEWIVVFGGIYAYSVIPGLGNHYRLHMSQLRGCLFPYATLDEGTSTPTLGNAGQKTRPSGMLELCYSTLLKSFFFSSVLQISFISNVHGLELVPLLLHYSIHHSTVSTSS